MSRLRNLLEAGEEAEAVQLIWRRLGGDHLDIPFDPASGESPADYLRYLNGTGLATRLAGAIAALLDETVPAAVEAMAANPSAAAAARLCELLRLLEDVDYVDRTGALARLCQRLVLLPPSGDLFVALQLAAFRAYVALDIDGRGRLFSLFSPAVDRPDLLPAYCIEAAKGDARTFLGPLSRHLFPVIADGPKRLDAELDFLAEAVRIAANRVHEDEGSEDKLLSLFGGFFDHVAKAARTKNGPPVRAAVLKGLSRSTLPALYIRNFEAAFWDSYPAANALLARSHGLPALQKWLHGQLPPPALDPAVGLGLNGVPYGEAGLFRLLSIVLQVGWDFRLNIVHDDYSEVGAALTEASLSLAVHNNSLLRQLAGRAGGALPVLASPPLLTFQNYDVLVSHAALRTSQDCQHLSRSAKDLAFGLLEGRQLERFDGNEASREDLAALIRQFGIYFLRNTDTQEVAELATGAKPHEFSRGEPFVFSSLNPDEGLERLLDGKVLLYFGGAIQSNYALKNCANRVSRAARIEKATELRFYIAKSAYQDARRRATYDFILKAWNLTREVWTLLRHEDRAPRSWGDARHALRDEIMIEVNRPQDMPNGFVSSFDDLFDLIQEHDTIHPMTDDVEFARPEDMSRPVLFEVGRRREAL